MNLCFLIINSGFLLMIFQISNDTDNRTTTDATTSMWGDETNIQLENIDLIPVFNLNPT